MTAAADFGVIGLGTMGRNLALNFADTGLRVAVWNLEPEVTAGFVESEGDRFVPAKTLADFVGSLAQPRKMLLMIKSGAPVDEVLGQLTPLLSAGDVVIDGGNSRFADTRRRVKQAKRSGVFYAGAGISGGEEGARYGPSIMFGGSGQSWEVVEDSLSSIAAKSDHGACAAYMGSDGAGHFVKMVHNGIEYAEMQCLAESYAMMSGSGLSADEMADVFSRWNEGEGQSFLMELTAGLLRKKDEGTGEPLVDVVLDVAGQKGTGRWTVEEAITLGIAVPSISAAVDARVVSAMKEERGQLSKTLGAGAISEPRPVDREALELALLAAKVCIYSQGFQLIAAGNASYGWDIRLADVARVWTGGCILRAAMLDQLVEIYTNQPRDLNLVSYPWAAGVLARTIPSLRQVVAAAVASGVALPVFTATLAWFDGVRSARLPQNLTQAQRDAFGAHGYLRTDDPTGEPRHSQWLD